MLFYMDGGAALPGAATGWQGVPGEVVAGLVCVEELPEAVPGTLPVLPPAVGDEL